MTGLVRKATLLAACGVILGAASAMAGVPSPGNSTVGVRINLSGVMVTGGLPDTLSNLTKYTVTVRDLANNPINGSSVQIDFNACNKSRICDSQIYQGMVTQAGPSVRSLSNAAGVATLVVTGGSVPSAPAAADAPGCALVYADGVLLGSISVGTYDLDGGSGVNGADLSVLASYIFGSPNTASCADFDNSGVVDGADLSQFLVPLFNPNGLASCATAYWP